MAITRTKEIMEAMMIIAKMFSHDSGGSDNDDGGNQW